MGTSGPSPRFGFHDCRRRGHPDRLVAFEGSNDIVVGAKQPASTRASRIACDAPLEPMGYIGCAASPRRVDRPNVQRSRIAVDHREQKGGGRRRIIAGTSSQSNLHSSNSGRKSSSYRLGSSPRRGQSRVRPTQFGNEVERLPAVGKVGDRVAHELLMRGRPRPLCARRGPARLGDPPPRSAPLQRGRPSPG